MAIAPNYTILDPLLDTSYSLLAMEGTASYADKGFGQPYVFHASQPHHFSQAQDTFEMLTGYNPIQRLMSISSEQQITAYQHRYPFLDYIHFGNLIINPTITTQAIMDLDLKTLNEQFTKLVGFFGFNKTEWAEIFSVRRPTIYGWLKNELKPSGDNANKIRRLYSLVNAIPNLQEGDKIFRGYIYHHINAYNCSLYEVFKSNFPGDGQIEELIGVLKSLLVKSRQKYRELEDLEKNEKASKSTFDYNMTRFFT